MATMLEKAKAVKVRVYLPRKFNEEEFPVLFAWLAGEITSKQVQGAFAKPTTGQTANILYRMATLSREAFQLGLLVKGKK